MMEMVVMIAGVVKLTSWLFDLVDLIERPTKRPLASTPTKARCKKPVDQPPQGEVGTDSISASPEVCKEETRWKQPN